jgi:putative resolvase
MPGEKAAVSAPPCGGLVPGRARASRRQAPTGTIIVTAGEVAPSAQPEQVAIDARVASPTQREQRERQAARRADSCAARGYQVGQVVQESASGVNDSRPTLLALLHDSSSTRSVVAQRDRLTRVGFDSLETLLQAQGRTSAVVTLAEHDEHEHEQEDLSTELVAIVSSFTARL